MPTITLKTGQMMHIKLLDIYFTERIQSKILGYALVQLSDKMKILMNVFKSDKGHIFLKMPSQKIGEEYKPCIEFINHNIERDITAAIGEEISRKFNTPSAGYVHPLAQPPLRDTQEFPF